MKTTAIPGIKRASRFSFNAKKEPAALK